MGGSFWSIFGGLICAPKNDLFFAPKNDLIYAPKNEVAAQKSGAHFGRFSEAHAELSLLTGILNMNCF